MPGLISATQALELVLSRAAPLDLGEVPLADGRGLVLGRPVIADRDYPPFDRATMDGFAVKLAHAGRRIRVAGESRPGMTSDVVPDEDACVEIMTGAPCPAGTEAVVMKEEVERSAADALLPAKIASGQNLVRAGTECRRGDVVVPAGAQIGAITTALLAGVGHETVWARRRPSVAVVVTGDEVVHGGSAPLPVKIRDSNGPMLMAMACDAGITRTRLHHVEDTREALARILESTADADVVVLTGGVSAGNYDFVPEALHAYGVAQAFHKVAQQPGKPIYFGTKGARLFFGLPGTPLGCHLGFFRYVVPALRVLAGSAPAHRSGSGTLTAPWSTRSDRQQFVLAAAEAAEGAWRLTPLVTRGSSDLFSAWSASAYLDIPEGTRELPPNAPVTFQWLRS